LKRLPEIFILVGLGLILGMAWQANRDGHFPQDPNPCAVRLADSYDAGFHNGALWEDRRWTDRIDVMEKKEINRKVKEALNENR
jgi:hypothetical protein